MPGRLCVLLLSPLILSYIVIAIVLTPLLWLCQCGRSPLSHILSRCMMSLHVSPIGPGLDALWMPLWKRRSRPRYWYAVVGKKGNQPQLSVLAVLPPKPKASVRIVFISDTHAKHDLIDVPLGDILCHSGDAFLRGSKCRCCSDDLQSFATYLRDLPHAGKVLIGGNHDADLESLDTIGVQELLGPSVRYLLYSGASVGGVSFFGSPRSRSSGSANRAFQDNLMDDPLASCPRGVDVLVSHARISDDELNRIRPRIHAYGHIHSDHGMHVRVGPDWHVLCLNASICDNYYRAIQHPVVVDLVV